jgi:hypothetical protein
MPEKVETIKAMLVNPVGVVSERKNEPKINTPRPKPMTDARNPIYVIARSGFVLYAVIMFSAYCSSFGNE